MQNRPDTSTLGHAEDAALCRIDIMSRELEGRNIETANAQSRPLKYLTKRIISSPDRRNKVIPLEQGDLLIFPSNFLYPHKVQPVKKGIRYSYISFVW
jgi:predicted 2-oxoglutarate/Fe(II)-dependent dioxygenase YbiX